MGEKDLQIFSDRLKEFRTSRKISQKDFAEKIGITASALSQYEKNTKNPSIGVAKRIAEVFHVSVDWLCGLSSEQSIKGEPITYADLLRLIVKVADTKPNGSTWLIRYDQNEQGDSCGVSYYPFCLMQTNDDTICEFFEDWEKMYTLYQNGTIDKHLYTLWLNDRISKYDYLALNGGFTNVPDNVPDDGLPFDN